MSEFVFRLNLGVQGPKTLTSTAKIDGLSPTPSASLFVEPELDVNLVEGSAGALDIGLALRFAAMVQYSQRNNMGDTTHVAGEIASPSIVLRGRNIGGVNGLGAYARVGTAVGFVNGQDNGAEVASLGGFQNPLDHLNAGLGIEFYGVSIGAFVYSDNFRGTGGAAGTKGAGFGVEVGINPMDWIYRAVNSDKTAMKEETKSTGSDDPLALFK